MASGGITGATSGRMRPCSAGGFAHRRHWVEQYHEEAKGLLGWDQYQGRLWSGFHRHAVSVMLAYSFLVWQEWRQRQERARPGARGGLFPPRPDRRRLSLPEVHRRICDWLRLEAVSGDDGEDARAPFARRARRVPEDSLAEPHGPVEPARRSNIYIHILSKIIDKQCLLLGQPLQIEEMRHGGVDQEAKDATQAAVVEGGKGDIARFLGMNDSPLSSPLSRIALHLPLPSQNSQMG